MQNEELSNENALRHATSVIDERWRVCEKKNLTMQSPL